MTDDYVKRIRRNIDVAPHYIATIVVVGYVVVEGYKLDPTTQGWMLMAALAGAALTSGLHVANERWNDAR